MIIPHPSELKEIYERNVIKSDLIDMTIKKIVEKMKEAAKAGESGVTYTFNKEFNEPTKESLLSCFLGMDYRVEYPKLSEQEAYAGCTKVRISWDM